MHDQTHLHARALGPGPGSWGPTRENTFWLLEPPNGSSQHFFENSVLANRFFFTANATPSKLACQLFPGKRVFGAVPTKSM